MRRQRRAAPGSRLAHALAVGLLAATALTASAGPGIAQDRSVVIEDMHAVYQVRPDGDVEVEERYRVRFNGEWNGLERVVSLRPPPGYAFDEPIGFRLGSTTNAQGEARRNEIRQDGRYIRRIRVYVPDASDRTANVVIRYTLSDVLGFFAADEGRSLPAMDEFYTAEAATA